ncbi:sugar phosphate nucleotidyltransferase [Pontibacillus salicampi]|uniref:Glucose-1-phosphate thymidylyltransferase n=1 Tax=Pontibacillus salicampi TaxID=1449801 RepID=A0ABV6LQ53_9BACI
MKGVILAGGTGSRLKPLTNIHNKHLLPVGRYPMIYWSIIKLKDAGIDDIIIVTNKHDLSSFIQLLGNGEEWNVKLTFMIQVKQGAGIADALLRAEPHIKGESVVVLLGDNVFEDPLDKYVHQFRKQGEGARVLLYKVDDPSRFGVPELDVKTNKIVAIHEKPKLPPSSYCVTGIYMFDDQVLSYIQQLTPSMRNELEITDVNNIYIEKGKLEFDILAGWWIDAGTHESLFKASALLYDMEQKRDVHEE